MFFYYGSKYRNVSAFPLKWRFFIDDSYIEQFLFPGQSRNEIRLGIIGRQRTVRTCKEIIETALRRQYRIERLRVSLTPRTAPRPCIALPDDEMVGIPYDLIIYGAYELIGDCNPSVRIGIISLLIAALYDHYVELF